MGDPVEAQEGQHPIRPGRREVVEPGGKTQCLRSKPASALVFGQVRRLQAHGVAEVLVEQITRPREAFGA